MNDLGIAVDTTVRGEAPVHRLLVRLDGVREVGPGRWLCIYRLHLQQRKHSRALRRLA